MKTLIKTAGAASLLALGVASANAAPLSQLYFSQNAGFHSPVVQFDPGALQEKGFFNPTDQSASPTDPNPVTPTDTYLKYAWEGANAPVESSIEIESFTDSSSPDADFGVGGSGTGANLKFAGDLLTADTSTDEWNLGDWWVIDTLTQTNNELLSLGGAYDPPLWTLDALANLRIYSDAARSDLLLVDANSKTTITFDETFNTSNVENCSTANPLGTRCDDVFTVIAAALDPISFVHNGYKYNINFALIPGASTDGQGGLQALQSEVVYNPDGTVSVYTPEIRPGTSSVHVLAQYTVAQIPEPAILGLFSAGLIGLGITARRRRKSA